MTSASSVSLGETHRTIITVEELSLLYERRCKMSNEIIDMDIFMLSKMTAEIRENNKREWISASQKYWSTEEK